MNEQLKPTGPRVIAPKIDSTFVTIISGFIRYINSMRYKTTVDEQIPRSDFSPISTLVNSPKNKTAEVSEPA